MPRRFVPMLLLTMALPILSPLSSGAAPECFAPTGPALLVCSAGGSARYAGARFEQRGVIVQIDGVAWSGIQASESGPGREEGSAACIEITSRRSYLGTCSNAIAVTIDDALGTASFKGTLVDRRAGLGRIAIDVTVTGDGTVEPSGEPGAGWRSTCFVNGAGAGSELVRRAGTAAGSVAFQRKLGRISATDGEGKLSLDASTGALAVTPERCADDNRQESSIGSCAGFAIWEPVYVGGVCVGGGVTSAGSTGFKVKDGSVFAIAAGESTEAPVAMLEYPGELATEPNDWICLSQRSKSSLMTICSMSYGGGDDDVSFDPLLRTGRIRTSLGFDHFGDVPYGPRISLGPSWRSAAIDLTFTPKAVSPDGAISTGGFAHCGFADTTTSVAALRAASDVTGTVRFKRTYAPVRGSQSKPLPGVMWTGLDSMTFVESPSCGSGTEDPEEGK